MQREGSLPRLELGVWGELRSGSVTLGKREDPGTGTILLLRRDDGFPGWGRVGWSLGERGWCLGRKIGAHPVPKAGPQKR